MSPGRLYLRLNLFTGKGGHRGPATAASFCIIPVVQVLRERHSADITHRAADIRYCSGPQRNRQPDIALRAADITHQMAVREVISILRTVISIHDSVISRTGSVISSFGRVISTH